MLKNYLKIILRDYRTNKVFSLVTILGLAFGIASVIVILTLIHTIRNFDQFHENGDRIVQLFSKTDYKNSGQQISSTMSAMVGPALVEEISGIENQTTIYTTGESWLSVKKNRIKQNGAYVNASVFDIFSFPIISQTSNKVFTSSNSIAISESLANKLFGNSNEALGKLIKHNYRDGKAEKFVSCIFKDIPQNSSIKFDFAYSIEEAKKEKKWLNRWGNRQSKVYLLLAEKASFNKINNNIYEFLSEKSHSKDTKLFLFNFNKIYLERPGSSFTRKILVNILFLAALGIFIIAGINYINISTSRASAKAKEIGLRKVIGANRLSLFIRFLGEAFINTLIAFTIAIFLANILIKIINEYFGEEGIIATPFSDLTFVFSLVLVLLAISLFSGLYPALFLSSLKPSRVLKGNTIIKNNWFGFKRGLVVFQFAISSLFIFMTAVFYFQMDFIKNKDLGIKINQVMSFTITNSIKEHLDVFNNELDNISEIEKRTFSDYKPIYAVSSTQDPHWKGKNKDLNDYFHVFDVLEEFCETFDVTILSGRSFKTFDEDENNFLINEAMADLIIDEEPLGTEISFWGKKGRVIGIIRDFHINDLKNEIAPLIIRMNDSNIKTAFIKFNANTIGNLIQKVEDVYNKFETNYPFEYSFLDDEFISNHRGITVLSNYAGLFSLISIIISCMGLIGLTALNINQKTKEIGIRKVLGASIHSILKILTKEVVIMSFIACSISLPIGFYIMDKWLQNYAYRIELGYSVALLSIGILILFSVSTVSFQAIKAALANPVESLRNE